MSLEKLQIYDLRLIEQADLALSPSFNLIYGKNASGKSTLLEAVDILSRGRSFRSRIVRELIRKDAQYLTLSASILDSSGLKHRVGIQKQRQATRLRIDGKPIQTMSTLATLLPVQLIHPEGYTLISGAPPERRAYMNWGVFHVKHEYLSVWRRYQRALQQRNKALRVHAPKETVSAWHTELQQTANEIDTLRSNYIAALTSHITQYSNLLFANDVVRVDYKRGWLNEESMFEALERKLPIDLDRGFTSVGPHRADLAVYLHDQQAAAYASRGQQKTLVAVLRLAQASLLLATQQSSCIFMVDDLASELDSDHRKAFLSALKNLKCQTIVTAIDPAFVNGEDFPEGRVFHVKQGRVQRSE